MQLLKKIGFFNTPNSKGEAYSPFNLFIDDIENKRSKLFPDRKRVPGRKTKYILLIAYLIHIYTVSKFVQARKLYASKAEQQRQISRKIAPFFQSIEDIQYTTLKHRQDLLMLEAFKPLGGEKYLQKFNRFNHSSIFIPSSTGKKHTEWQKGGTTRSGKPGKYHYQGVYLSGYDIQNI